MIVVLGELGGRDEYSLVEALKQGKINKPVVAWVSGTCATLFKSEVQFGHAVSINLKFLLVEPCFRAFYDMDYISQILLLFVIRGQRAVERWNLHRPRMKHSEKLELLFPLLLRHLKVQSRKHSRNWYVLGNFIMLELDFTLLSIRHVA